MPTAFAVLCIAALGVLLAGERSNRRALRFVGKPVASLAFLGVALSRHPASSVDLLLLAGLVLGAVGDVALLFEGEAAFLGGLGAFLLGHSAYVVAFAALTPVSSWGGAPAVGMAVFAVVVLRWLWPRLGPMRVPVVAYVAVICTMVVGALAALARGVPGAHRLAAGAVLFAVSDLAVARDRFVADDFSNKAWGLPLYYAAQLVLAFAIGHG